MYAQPVQNASHGNTAVKDITLTYTVADLKFFHLQSTWRVEAQASTWQAIHHGFASRKDFNGIVAIRLRIMLLLTVRSGPKPCSNLILLC